MIFLAGLSPAFAQDIVLGPNKSFYCSLADTVNGKYFLFKGDSMLVVDLNTWTVVDRQSIVPPDGWYRQKYVPVLWKGSPCLVDNGGGWILQLSNGRWERIDNSFEHKMQVESTLFTRNDTIFRFGGYGFWSARNFFTYFSGKKGEWEALSPLHSKIFPPGLVGSIVQNGGPDWYVLSGAQILPSNLGHSVLNEEVWVFHRDRLEWEKVGRMRINLSDLMFTCEIGDRLLVSHNRPDDHPMMIDLQKNRYIQYNPLLSDLGIYTFSQFNPFIYKGQLCYTRITSGSDQMLLARNPISEILKNPNKKGRVYNRFPHLVNLLLPAAVVLIALISLLILRVIRRKKQYIRRSGNNLTYRSRKVELDDIQLAVMDLLLASEEVTSDEIIAIAGNDQLHPSHKIRIKNAVIDQLNLKFNILLNNNEKLITAEPSKVDKRIRVYRLNREYFEK